MRRPRIMGAQVSLMDIPIGVLILHELLDLRIRFFTHVSRGEDESFGHCDPPTVELDDPALEKKLCYIFKEMEADRTWAMLGVSNVHRGIPRIPRLNQFF